MASDSSDTAKQARADRREAERQARVRTGKPAAVVTPAAARQRDRDQAKNN